MKILTVTPWFPSLEANSLESQQGIFEYRQAMKLAQGRNEFRVISVRWADQAHHEATGDKLQVYRVAGWFAFPKIRYPIPNFVGLTRQIRNICASWKPDIIIYSHMIYLTALPILWLRNRANAPTIATTDAFPGVSWFYGNKIVDGVGYLYSMLIGKRIFKLADAVQLGSSGLSKYTGKLSLDSNKTFIVPRGVDTNLFKPRDGEGRLTNALGIGQNDIVVLYVGRLDLVKGVNYLLQAGQKVLPRWRRTKFIIVGDGSLRREHERFAKPLFPNIIFTGWRDDVPQLMNISDIFVLPSLSEGAANVAMEASASGLPVIASEVGEVPQIVSNGETGILVKPRDVESLVTAIEKLINDPSLAKKMGEAGRKRMVERYSWEIICDKLQKAYQEVIDRFSASNCHLVG